MLIRSNWLKCKFGSILSLLMVPYFFMAPIYYPPGINHDLWLFVKLVLLASIFAVSVIGVFRHRYLRIGIEEGVFCVAVAVSMVYFIRGIDLFFPLVSGYFFYFIGRSHLPFEGAKHLKGVVWACRLSGIYIGYVLLMCVKGGGYEIATGGLNVNSFALYLASVSAVLFYSYDKSHKLYDGLVIGLAGALMLVIGSRGGLLLFVVMAGLYVVHNFGWRSASLLVVLITAFLVLLLDPVLLSDVRVYQQYHQYAQGNDFDLSSGRLPGYGVAIELFYRHPLFGFGSIDLTEYGLGYKQVHNFYLRILAEGGMVLFFSVLSLLAVLSLKIYFSEFPRRLLPLSCLSLLVIPLLYEPNGLFGNFMIAGTLWYVMGFLSGHRKFEK